MTIQWYPGHMHKAQKAMREVLPKVDVIIEVLDARIPFSSENPLLKTIRRDKPCVKVLTKHDLSDPERVAEWQLYLEQERDLKTLAVSTEDLQSIKKIPALCRKVAPPKSSARALRAMVAGIPNAGKSTLINALAGRAVAKTGNEPAVTKAQQSIRIEDDFFLLDTPGVLWPKQDLIRSSYRLAATGAIRDTAMDYLDVGFFLVEFLRSHYRDCLIQKFSLDSVDTDSVENLIERIGHQLGCLGRGGRIDLSRACERIVQDFRRGALGRICLERPAMVEAELIAFEQARVEALAKKEAETPQKKKKRR